jgi:large subunit ribosomal protein L10
MAVPLKENPGSRSEGRCNRCLGKSCSISTDRAATRRGTRREEWTLSLNRNEKQTVVTDVAAQAARSQTLALAEYRGLTVEHLNVLR